MKVLKKILIVLAIAFIIIGMFLLGKNGLNYSEGYTKGILIDTAKQYISYLIIATAVILLYFAIKYNKKGVIKVLATSIIAIIATALLILAIMAITKIPTSRLFFSVMLGGYVSCILSLSANFEGNT